MRPSGLILILGVLAAPPASAQEVAPGDTASTPESRAAAWYTRPAVGVQVGYSRTDLAVGEGGNLLTSRQGAITGAYLHFPLSDALAIRPELLFSLKGGSTVANVGGQSQAVDIELAYIELPLLLRASFPTGSVRPVLFAGPALAIQIGCDFSFADSVRSTCGQDSLPPLVRSWDFGLVGGGGIEKRLRRATIALEARYTVGTRSVLEDLELKNRAFGLLLAVTF
jgi:hypothetical protein